MSDLLGEVSTHRKHIKHETITFSLSELVNMYKSDPPEIVVNPTFQRLFRWTRAQQSAFIESLILEIPIPPLFFFETEDGKWELLDGLQRLSTIIKFMGTEKDVPIEFQGKGNNEDEWHYKNENNIDEPLQLVSGEYLKSLEGISFQRLPSQLLLNSKRARLQIYVLKRETHHTYKYEVFKRLNRGGADLENQELRNCTIRLLDEKFPQFLQDISKNPVFVDVLGLTTEDTRNGYIEELALRFFAMKNYSHAFEHHVDDFMTRYMEEVAKKTVVFNYKMEEDLFTKTWTTINAALPEGEAFRTKNKHGNSQGPFSPTLFELVSLSVALNIDKASALPADDLRDKIVKLILKTKNVLTGSGSNSKKKTIGRVKFAQDWLKP